MNIDQLEALARAATPGPWRYNVNGEVGPISKEDDQSYGMVLPVANVYGDNGTVDLEYIAAANPAAILALISDNRSRRNMLDMIVNSVGLALDRAGVKDVDDPGEAIDVLVADKDAEIARLREALKGLLDAHAVPSTGCKERGAYEAALATLATTGDEYGR